MGLIAALLLSALFAALPWLGCISSVRAAAFAIPNVSVMWDVCTFGTGFRSPTTGIDLPGFTSPYWGNLIVGIAYVVGALYLAFTKRSL